MCKRKPATAHCILEQAGWLPAAGECCEQKPGTDEIPFNPCAVSCCPSEIAAYSSLATGSHTQLIAELPGSEVKPVLIQQPESNTTVFPESSPPELPKAWQFFFRAALPPRAPSSVS